MIRRSIVAVIVAAVVAASSAAGASQQTPKRGGTVVVGDPEEPACLNVLLDRCGGFAGNASRLVTQVLEGAFDIGPDLAYKPDLVARVTITKEPFALTYHIRPEARWSDGTPVTAGDFVLSLQAASKYTELLGEETIGRVRTVDAKTVKVDLRSRYSGWQGFFEVILPRHILAGQDFETVWEDTLDNPKSRRPIGSGPFLLARWERGKQVTLVRNPRYWGPHTAYLDRLVIRFVPDPIEALLEGDVDLIAAPVDAVPELRRQPGIKILTIPSLRWEHFDIRAGPGGHPALRNKLVRRALAYGIDREALVRALFGEFLPSPQPLDSVVFLANSRFYRPNWQGYRYRPAESRRLLEQAGCRRGVDGIYVCGGERLSLRFVTTTGRPVRELTIRLAQAQLRQAGVEVVPVFAPPPVFFETILPSGDFDVALFAWQNAPIQSDHVDVFGCGGEANYMGYCQRLVTADLDQADRILDAGRRARVLNRADAQIVKDVPAIPLYQPPAVVALRTNIRGVVPHPWISGLTWNSEDWWLAPER